jgi:hypothetical protein
MQKLLKIGLGLGPDPRIHEKHVGRESQPTRSTIITAVDMPGDHGAADPSLIQDRETGRLFLFYGYCLGRNDVAEGSLADRRHLVMQYVTSDDDGKTWSLPVHVDMVLREDDWHSMWPGPGRGVQLSDGRLVVPCTAAPATRA